MSSAATSASSSTIAPSGGEEAIAGSGGRELEEEEAPATGPVFERRRNRARAFASGASTGFALALALGVAAPKADEGGAPALALGADGEAFARPGLYARNTVPAGGGATSGKSLSATTSLECPQHLHNSAVPSCPTRSQLVQ